MRMTKRVAGSLAAMLAVTALAGCGSAAQDKASETRFALGTVITLTAYGAGANDAVGSAFSRIQRIENEMSVRIQDSQIAVLNKNGTYAREERQNIEQHPAVGYRILNLFDETIDLAEAVLYHHENWDGSGYPVGVRGEEIPRQARILRIAETYDALTGAFGSSSMSDEEALEEIKRHSGSMFDPEIVKVFVGMMSGKK